MQGLTKRTNLLNIQTFASYLYILMTDLETHKAGFVSIIGKPNAGKSTLLNTILQDKLAIVSNKVQTTRHRILGLLSEPSYQIVFSDTPGIIESNYKLHERMMGHVHKSLKDADVVILLIDASDNIKEAKEMLAKMQLAMPVLVLINKIDKHKNVQLAVWQKMFLEIKGIEGVYAISALANIGISSVLENIINLLPIHPPYYDGEEISDRPTKFFVSEIIREQLYTQLEQELPYHCAVIIETYQEKTTLTKIVASIVVGRESQKMIVIGSGGSVIKKIGTLARQQIEKFIDSKVFLELHVKVRDNWRNNETFLNEYGY
jgi:GTPase